LYKSMSGRSIEKSTACSYEKKGGNPWMIAYFV
jgi:hypothetical protein